MGTQLSVIKPTERKYETTCHDDIIVLLGCELDGLAHEYKRLDDVASDTTDDVNRMHARSARDDAYDRMQDICSALAGLKAESMEGAAIQMRVIRNYSSMDYDEVETKMNTLIASVVGVLESHGGFGRDKWAGIFYFGASDPFDRIEV